MKKNFLEINSVLIFLSFFVLGFFFNMNNASAISSGKVMTDPATEITGETAQGYGNVVGLDDKESLERFIEWGAISGKYDQSCSAGVGGNGSYACDMSGLAPKTEYYFRTKIVSSQGTAYGNEAKFVTIISLPAVSSQAVSRIRSSSATANAELINTGGEEPDRSVEWGTSSGGYDRTCSAGKGKAGNYYCNMGELSPFTTYYYRAKAENSAGVAYGDEMSFTTLSLLAAVSTSAVTNISATSAQGNGILNSTGGENPILFIDWGKTSGVYDSGSCNVGVGGVGAYACNLIELNPNTKYYVRATAINSAGAIHGNEVVFTTPKQAPAVKTISDMLRESPAVKNSSVVASSAGLAAGATAAAATGAFPVIPLSPTPFSDIVSRLFGLFGIFSRAKRKLNWGAVFDRETRRPIVGAMITIVNADGRDVDSMTTNVDGRFGFLASKGEYSFRISKDNYELSIEDDTDEFYGKLYDGKTFSIEEGEIAEMNISLKAINIDWQDFAKRKSSLYRLIFSMVKKDIFPIMFYTGFVISAGMLYLVPSVFNGIMIVMYLGMSVRNIFFKSKNFGLITGHGNESIPFAIVSLYENSQMEKRTTFAVSDIIGRYFVLTENGKYHMKVQGRELGGRPFKKFIDIEVEDGVYKEDIAVDESDYLKIN